MNLEQLVGRRFNDINHIETTLKELGATEPNVIESNSLLVEGQDLMLDGSLDSRLSADENDDFSLFYIKTRTNQYYITEVNFWG
tara:strand:+ start:413 stop:664 length:252 start_codon:yes stop_codon:yes gene_type:complete